jgi:transcriptional regulator of arginine metabolism
MTKSYRQGQILNLIRSKKITTQEELARELRALGIVAKQVTLSRDLREMGLAKTPDGYREILPETTGPDLETVLNEFLLDVRRAENLIVLKTLAGNANTVAVALDQQDWPEIVGTIAGDDTVCVICWDDGRGKTVQEKLLAYVEG